ncbi:MAG: TRCF domain-containing protein, partial [Burkholderiales bacterium]
LEIRGAGNLLGAEQSGFMAAVGFDLYVNLLSGAVEHMRALMRGVAPPPEAEVLGPSIDLPLSAHLPASYVPDVNMRLALYQRLTGSTDAQEVASIMQEMGDRFGEPPPLARNLLYLVLLRILAGRAKVETITSENGIATVRMEEGIILPKEALEEHAPRGVAVGRTQLRIELNEGWRERLRTALEQLAARGEERDQETVSVPA